MNTYMLIYTLLAERGRNPHQLPLTILSRVDPYAKELQPGTWIVRTNMSANGILDLLRDDIVHGDKVMVVQLTSETRVATEGLSPGAKELLTVK